MMVTHILPSQEKVTTLHCPISRKFTPKNRQKRAKNVVYVGIVPPSDGGSVRVILALI